MAGAHSRSLSERPARLSSLSQSNSRFDFTRLARPPTKHTDELLTTADIPTNMPRQNQILWVSGSAVQPSAGLPSSHSFHGEVWRSGRLLLSIPLVQLCAAHTPKPRRARFRALSVPLRSGG